jgi:DNA-binding NtrC family response regulator
MSVNGSERYPSYAVILVDDEQSSLMTAAFALRKARITNVETIQDSRLVMDRVERGGCGIMVLDLDMPHVSGMEILKRVAKDYPEISVIMATGLNEVSSAVECMKLGASDYIVKPVHYGKLADLILHTIESKALQKECAALKRGILDSSLKHPEAFAPIITNNAAMRSLFKYAEVIGGTDLPILIAGETGTGKELMAQAIHAASERKGKFVSVNVSGIDDLVMSDTLFGHVRGAFTGADQLRKGLLEEAAHGTLFLDEIGDLKLDSQVKLLRVLQERTFHPVGADTALVATARIVAATNRDLKAMVRAGEFRHDLFYRLQAHEVKLPPLRDRIDDMPYLVDAFVEEGSQILNAPRPVLSPELLTLLSTYHWPGNVRELRGLLIDALSRNQTNMLSLAYLKDKLKELRGALGTYEVGVLPDGPSYGAMSFPLTLPTISQMEVALIREALHRTNGNKSQAADLLGIARTTLINKLKESDAVKE